MFFLLKAELDEGLQYVTHPWVWQLQNDLEMLAELDGTWWVEKVVDNPAMLISDIEPREEFIFFDTNQLKASETVCCEAPQPIVHGKICIEAMDGLMPKYICCKQNNEGQKCGK
eukprot:695121-Lingulodinium_polyedra.AAC.1